MDDVLCLHAEEETFQIEVQQKDDTCNSEQNAYTYTATTVVCMKNKQTNYT